MLSTFIAALVVAQTAPVVVAPAFPQPRVSEKTGAVELEFGSLSPPLAGDLVVAVRQWALAQKGRYGLPAGASLTSSDAFSTRFGASFHLLQTVREVEVYGAKLVVTLGLDLKVNQVASSLVPATRVLDTWVVSHDEGMKLAAKKVDFTVLRPDGVPYGGAKAYLFPVGDELHAGWLVNVHTVDLSKNWYVAIDAVTGQTLFTQNRVHHGALDAKVYPVSPGGLDAGVGATPTVTRQLAYADGGSMIGDLCAMPQADGGIENVPNDAGYLCGNQLMSYNCCVTEGCVPDAGPRRFVGTLSTMGLSLSVDIALCDRLRRASNVQNPSGDYVYTPADPPADKTKVVASDPANSDAFAEVHSFYHVNRVYEWVRGLSRTAAPIFGGTPGILPFTMRDAKRTPAQTVAVWSNAMFPDTNELLSDLSCLIPPKVCKSTNLMRIDNAAFLPRENFAQIPVPGFDTGVDTLLIFQGNSADAAYDATVIQHEFGHGVVYSTANLSFGDLALDANSANNEGGALHEGFADYIAGAFNNLAEIGPYFGPRALAAAGVPGVAQETFLRTLDNTLSCPTILWGEVHQDSQHVSAALWKARTTTFAGTDQGNTFDATFYAMLVSIAPNADFASVADVMAQKVGVAFPSVANASAQMTKIFQDKGVIGCTKVIDVTGATTKRPYYGISAAASLQNSLIPGPYQFKLSAPMGVKTVKVNGMVQQSPFGQGPTITAMVKVDAPIVFTKAGDSLTNDATKIFNLASGAGSVALDAPCGSTVYVSLGTVGGGTAIQNVSVTIDPATSCNMGVDAGMMTPDAGHTVTLPGVSTVSGTPAKTCGCSTLDASLLVGALALFTLRRRSR